MTVVTRKHARYGVCERCDLVFRNSQARPTRFCSRACADRRLLRPRSWSRQKQGYLVRDIRQPDGSWRRVYQHREVMEHTLGRRLEPWEDVHHVDGDRANNDPANLEVLARATHARVTAARLTPEQLARRSAAAARARYGPTKE